MVVERETIGAQAAQPAISDSRSVLRQRRCQPVSRKVHEGAEKGGNENQFPYSLPTTKFFKFRWGKRRNWYVSFSPVTPPLDFVSKTFLGDITFSPRSIREPDNSSQTAMVSTSSKAVKVAPKMVGAGLENAATGSGMSERKRAASMSPPKPRISSNLDGRRGRLGRAARNESDVAAGATKGADQTPTAGKKTRSGAKEASGATTAPDDGDKIPKGHVGRSSKVPAIMLPTSRLRADSEESGGDGSSKCKEAGGAQDIIVHRLIALFGPDFRVSYATEALPEFTIVASLRDCFALGVLICGGFRLVDAPPPHITVPPSETFFPPWSPSRG